MLHEHLYREVLVYLGNILIYTEIMAEHVKLVRAVLKKLQAAHLYAKLSKCEFHQSEIDYLGYHISHKGLEMDPESCIRLGYTSLPESNCKPSWGLPTFTINLSLRLPKSLSPLPTC